MEALDKWLLTLVVGLPAVGAIVVAMAPKDREKEIKGLALLFSGASMVFSILALLRFNFDNSKGFQFYVSKSWIKTINANERDDVYQTDTGPILYPDLSREPDELIEGLELAFAAFNCPTWIELIVRTATDAANGVRVYHYSKTARLEVRNQVFRLKANS